MVMRLSNQQRFIVEWTVLNVIGFMVGSFLGATDGGIVPAALGHTLVAKIIGDILFGAAFGLAQVIVFWRHFPQSRGRAWIWILASIIGFTAGVRLGTRFGPQITQAEPWLGLVFGVIVGGSLGLAEWAAMRWLGVLTTQSSVWWIPASTIAWIIGEAIAFASNFSQATVPLVAIGIALTTGIALMVWIRPR